MEFRYEQLEVVKLSRALTIEVYLITRSWPREEIFAGGLGNQARRAAVSVSLNIAEGSGGTKADNARFVTIATRSLLEVRECFATAVGLGYISSETERELCSKIATLYFKLLHLRDFLKQ